MSRKTTPAGPPPPGFTPGPRHKVFGISDDLLNTTRAILMGEKPEVEEVKEEVKEEEVEEPVDLGESGMDDLLGKLDELGSEDSSDETDSKKSKKKDSEDEMDDLMGKLDEL